MPPSTNDRGSKLMRNNIDNKPKKYLTTGPAAEYIGRHRSSLDKWRAAKIVLPFYQDGQKITYCTDDLDNYLASKRVEPIAYRPVTASFIPTKVLSCYGIASDELDDRARSLVRDEVQGSVDGQNEPLLSFDPILGAKLKRRPR